MEAGMQGVALFLILGVIITFLIDVYLESPPALYSMTTSGIVMIVLPVLRSCSSAAGSS